MKESSAILTRVSADTLVRSPPVICCLYTKQYKFHIRIISHVKVQETVKSQMSATTRLLTWFGRLSNTAQPYSKSISIIKMYSTNKIDS